MRCCDKVILLFVASTYLLINVRIVQRIRGMVFLFCFFFYCVHRCDKIILFFVALMYLLINVRVVQRIRVVPVFAKTMCTIVCDKVVLFMWC